MPLSLEMQRLRLLRSLRRGFDFTEEEAATVATALRRDGALTEIMHSEIMVGHPRLQSRHQLLRDELRDYLTSKNVDANLVNLLANKICSRWSYIYYVLRDGETYGAFAYAESAI